MPRTFPSQVLRFIASIAVIILLATPPAAAAPQKPAPPPPTSQAQLEARVKDLESRLAAAEQKAASAAMEKDYILRTQNHYETYYKEVFSTQTHILWTIGVTATLLSITLAAVFFIAGRFGFNIFDRRIEMALKQASADLRTEFAERLANETNALQEAHASELKTLEDGLTKRVAQQEQDLTTRSQYQFQFAQAFSLFANESWDGAIRTFRYALGIYKQGKPRGIFEDRQGRRVTANIFNSIRKRDGAKFEVAAKKELELDVYKGLEDELNFAATEVPELGPLLKERNLAPSPSSAVEPRPAAPPADSTPKDEL